MSRSLVQNTCLLLALGGFLFAGCQKDNPAGPTEPSQSAAVRVLAMPQGSLQKITSVSETITVASGGKLTLQYSDGSKKDGNAVRLDLEVSFAPRTVTSDFLATMSADAYYAMASLDMELAPQSVTFTQPANVKMHVTGMDLSQMPQGTQLHLFFDDNGTWVAMPGTVTYNRQTGEVKCQDGQLPHFSRYAFGY